jgi:TolB-like protein
MFVRSFLSRCYSASTAPVAPTVSGTAEKPVVAVQTSRLISGDDEVKALAEGLTAAIADALGDPTALSVRSGDPGGADFLLKGSVQAAGKRLRLSFGLEEGTLATQIWTQRYDRQLEDVFGL